MCDFSKVRLQSLLANLQRSALRGQLCFMFASYVRGFYILNSLWVMLFAHGGVLSKDTVRVCISIV